jgi:hypothetical protein
MCPAYQLTQEDYRISADLMLGGIPPMRLSKYDVSDTNKSTVGWVMPEKISYTTEVVAAWSGHRT